MEKETWMPDLMFNRKKNSRLFLKLKSNFRKKFIVDISRHLCLEKSIAGIDLLLTPCLGRDGVICLPTKKTWPIELNHGLEIVPTGATKNRISKTRMVGPPKSVDSSS